MEGIVLVIRCRLGQKQKFFLPERLRCASILNPMYLKLQQTDQGCDYGNKNAQSTDRNLDREGLSCKARQEWNCRCGDDLSKTQPLEPAFIRDALTVIPPDLIVYPLLDVVLRGNHFSYAVTNWFDLSGRTRESVTP